jgi:hypothetical protein
VLVLMGVVVGGNLWVLLLGGVIVVFEVLVLVLMLMGVIAGVCWCWWVFVLVNIDVGE